ncbi:MAG: ATP synthase F0 subunit B [Bifidobacterium tibiigranuli]|jgi:cell division septum initiation protein DivIVA|nr:ATP synthase F0 subunit B [Bifidobacterium tibiigranuli]MCI1649535.1 ATP synthase F0 subunit B [Bifidobacterium tibiigranuli]MCI2185005.1 ATP synthase F0 subunit B [Bifidobacterium tibiigranuli]MCI2203430.1 ATP synthase F0 subunit B [Bifidobacterium tibiigranuli]
MAGTNAMNDGDYPGEPADDTADSMRSNLGSQPIRSESPNAGGAADSDSPNQGQVRNLFPMSSLPDLREDSGADAPDSAQSRSRAEFTTVYDILDHLEETLHEAKGSLFSPGTVKVDRIEFEERIDELKDKLPVQLERASSLMRESERRLENAQSQSNAIIASAQSRAAQMVQEAQDQAQFLAGQENVTELARQKARAILDQAQAKAEQLTQGANQYCATVMSGLQEQLGKLGHDVQAGLDVLNERQQAAAEQLPHLDRNDYPEG